MQYTPLSMTADADKEPHIARRYIARQLEARSEVPGEVWGCDQSRRRVARFIARVIQQIGEWPNDYFVPDDPLEVLWVTGDDYLLTIGTLSDELSVQIGDADFQDKAQMTFGQLVDLVLEKLKAEHVCIPPEPLSRQGLRAIASVPCPRGAVFRDIRRFLKEELLPNTVQIRPSTPLRLLMPTAKLTQLDDYARHRFGVADATVWKVFGVVPVRVALFALYICAAWLSATIQSLGFSAIECGLLVVALALPAAWVLAARAKPVLRWRHRTLGHLAKWIAAKQRKGGAASVIR